MIIDFHTHYHEGQGPIDNLLVAMDEQGVDMAVVSAVVTPGGDNGHAANALVHKAVQAFPSRLVGLGCIVPYLPDAPEMLEYYVGELGFRGLKLHPSMQQFYPSDQRIYPVIEKAIDLDVPVLIHTGAVPIPGTRSRYDDPLEVDDLALVYPEAKLVIAHGDPFGTAPAIAGKHANVYMDTTTTFARYCRLIPGLGEDTLKFMGLVSGESGASKVLFGSDAHPLKTFRLEENLAPLRALDISDKEKRQILGGNAARLLKLECGIDNELS
jgi:predicted TIM-barrel fold metal-dependent hydrolase